jgi:hypothetical protein
MRARQAGNPPQPPFKKGGSKFLAPSVKGGRRVAAGGFLILLLTGCAATATQNWRTAPELSSPVWKITGEQGAWGAMKVSINDELVLDGRVSIWTGTGQLEGTYDGKPVTADCKKGRGSKVRTQCALTIDGRKATTLYFRVK